MLKFRIICPGKLKKGWAEDACTEFLKKIKPYAAIEIKELGTASVEEETHLILRTLAPGNIKIYCDIGGEMMNSRELAAFFARLAIQGQSAFDIVIGGSYGILPEAISKFDRRISFSAMTYNHRLFRIMLLEQIYRTLTINSSHPYHH